MKHIIISLTLGLALTLALLVLLPPGALTKSISSGSAAEGVIYVDCDATEDGDGQTWTTAYKSLQKALDEAQPTDQIWVAAGVYTPTDGITSTATFQLIDDVTLYGGFEGERDDEGMDDRDWQRNLTILSGDLDDDDDTFNNIITDVDDITGTNAYHVVTGSGVTTTAVLDGFIITAGDAAVGSTDYEQSGGGMYNDNGSPTLRNVTFSGNQASALGGGGGMANWNDSNPILTNVTFSDNQAPGYYGGGGMLNMYGSSPQLTHVRFERNQAPIYGSLGTPTDGGGMANWYNSNSTLTDVVFVDNYASRYGGGMANSNNSEPTLSNVIFDSNQAGEDGGGMEHRNCNAELTNVTFVGNRAKNGGGMASSADAILINVLFSGNYASNNGGGMHNTISGSNLVNVTFSGNYANNLGGGIYYYGNGNHLTLVNTIMWGDRDDTNEGPSEIHNENGDPITIIASDIEGYSDSSLDSFDPWFIDPVPAGQAPNTDGNYHLRAGSPAIDAGENLSVTVITDLDGKARIADGIRDGESIVDMGAHESYTPIYVDHDAVGPDHNGLTWTSAYTNIQKALDVANPGDEIWVAEGIYYPDEGEGQVDNDPDSAFPLKRGVAIYGGFAGGDDGEGMNTRDSQNNITILSGDLQKDDLAPGGIVTNTDDISGTNAYHVVIGNSIFITESTRLDGFIITAGYADGNTLDNMRGGGYTNYLSSPTLANLIFSGNYAGSNGGGMYINISYKPTLVNVTFSGNYADGNGGGMYDEGASFNTLTLDEVTFRSNYASEEGGGMYNTGRSILTQVAFDDNHANANGGGMYNIDGDLTILNTTFRSNQANENGGGMYNNFSNPTLVNVLFGDNLANNGGGMYNDAGNSEPILLNVTFSGNQAANSGGGMYNDSASCTPSIANSILWGNQAEGSGAEIYNANGSNPTISYSNLPDDYPGINNLSLTPQFVNPSEGNYRLGPNSPLIDRGDNASLNETITITSDLDGNPRFVDGNEEIEGAVVDMGAYEFRSMVSLIMALAGSGTGSVSSSHPGIDCPGNCIYDFPIGSAITLTAVPSANSTFTSWSIASCATDLTCPLTLEAEMTITATFTLENQIYLPLVVR